MSKLTWSGSAGKRPNPLPLLVETGETDQAAKLFQYVLDTRMPGYINLSVLLRRETGIQQMLTLALAGLAFVHSDRAMAAQAAEITRESSGARQLQIKLLRGLLDLLMQESNGEILTPIRNVLKPRLGPSTEDSA